MKPIQILLVEDNEGDVLLTMEALKEAKINNEVIVARDGEQAITMLNESVTQPDLILLDINLPRIDGMEVLAYIKNNEQLKSIPVIMLSTSSDERDIKGSYQHHANCFISKPVGLQNFMEVIRTIENFWISIVKLPQRA